MEYQFYLSYFAIGLALAIVMRRNRSLRADEGPAGGWFYLLAMLMVWPYILFSGFVALINSARERYHRGAAARNRRR